MNPWDAIVYWYKNTFCPKLKITFLSAMITGILAHFFCLTNVLNNYDSITNIPTGVGTTVSSGRWFLMYMEKFQDKFWQPYSLPFFNGLITLLLLSVCACLITELFHIQNPLNRILVGAILICFPTITSTMFFMFCAPHYATAILFAVLAVYLADKKWWGFLCSFLFLACSMGIYQAYLPVTASLMVLYLAWNALRKEYDWKKLLQRGIKYFLILICGFLVYMGITNLTLKHYDVVLNDYQGINNMGKLSLSQIPSIILKIYKNFYHLTKQNYCGLSATFVIQKGLILLGILSFILILYYLFAYKRCLMERLLIVFLFILIPIAADSIEIMCPQSVIYTLMVYGMVVIYLIPILLLELLADQQAFHQKKAKLRMSPRFKSFFTWTISLCMMIMICNYIWSSNVNYTLMYYADVETQEYLSSMVTRMRSVPDYSTDAPVAFIGKNISDPSYAEIWKKADVIYGGNESSLINHYSRNRFMKVLLSYKYKKADEPQIQALQSLPEVQRMNCYPNDNSIKMIDGILVIKLEDFSATENN